MRKRLWIVFSLVVVVLSGIAVWLFHIVQTRPAEVASSQNRWTVSVANTRGTIYDRTLSPFVNEKREYRAALMPSESLLSLVYSATTEARFTVLRDQLSDGAPSMVRLTKPIGFADGLRLFWVPVRYSDRLLAPHILGYLDNSGSNGVTGIEAAFDDVLRQYNGYASASFDIDARGNLLAGVEPQAVDTTDRSIGGVVLTLDKTVQTLTEDVAQAHLKKGAVIVMDPNDGGILSVASYPSFQPQTVADSMEKNDGSLINRALSLYDCGSVFKIITSAAALEARISPAQTYECAGYIEIEGTRFHCHNRLGHGKLGMYDAFAQSCNIYFIRLAQTIGAEVLLSTAEGFGLDKPMKLAENLDAAASLLPTKSAITTSKAALANFSFGQGYLMVTPLHFAQIVSTIVNDGVMPPTRLVNGTVDENKKFFQAEKGRGERVISGTTAQTLREMMVQTVLCGTGVSAMPDTCSAAGKTGTAETGQISNDKDVIQSWFVGYFPAEDPQYVVCVLAEDANNTDVKATDVFRQLADVITANLTNK